MSGSDYERELMRILRARGRRVVRSAGSMGEGDVVVIHPILRGQGECMDPAWSGGSILEAKAVGAREPYYRPSKRVKDRAQYAVALEMEGAGYDEWYALRVKAAPGGRVAGWRFCRPSGFSRTRTGEPVFRPADGLGLEEFLEAVPGGV